MQRWGNSRFDLPALRLLMQPNRRTRLWRGPDPLVYWAPIVDELKSSDESIVRNSIRFRWQASRRELQEALEPAWVLDSLDNSAVTPG